jgi:hypothetical protein
MTDQPTSTVESVQARVDGVGRIADVVQPGSRRQQAYIGGSDERTK